MNNRDALLAGIFILLAIGVVILGAGVAQLQDISTAFFQMNIILDNMKELM